MSEWAALAGRPYVADLSKARLWIECSPSRKRVCPQERALEVSHKGWSIRHRLMLLALAVALPFVLLTAGIMWQLANNERETRREAILFSTRTLMNAVDTVLSKQIAVAQMLATSPALLSDDMAAFRQEAGRAAKGLGGSWVVLSNQDGQQLVNLRVRPDTPLP